MITIGYTGPVKLHQLRYLSEIARQGLSFSGAAAALHTSQPGISKQVRLLEEELGVDLFIRNGNRILEMTEPALRIVAIANLVFRELDDIKAVASEFREGGAGRLNLAATFTFARYLLPDALRRFVASHPKVEVSLLQGSSTEVSRLASSGAADIALTTRPAEDFPDLLFVEYRQLPRVLVTPPGHPLLKEKRVTLKAISRYPLRAGGRRPAAGGYRSAARPEAALARRRPSFRAPRRLPGDPQEPLLARLRVRFHRGADLDHRPPGGGKGARRGACRALRDRSGDRSEDQSGVKARSRGC
jgi:DNA-binding transcriptional LysR family regulator